MPEIPVPDPPLRDDEIALRPWLAEDVPQVAAHCQDPEIARWTQVPSPYGEEQARDFVGGAEGRRLAGQELALAIVSPDDRVLGSVALQAGAEEGRAKRGLPAGGAARRLQA
jgi:RimJ/RimL family protein N-acetyltransferase